MLFDANLPQDEKYPKGWRQLGCELAELQRGSNMDIYYNKLAEVKSLIEADMEFLRPTVHETNGVVPLPEKVADSTHRGPGL